MPVEVSNHYPAPLERSSGFCALCRAIVDKEMIADPCREVLTAVDEGAILAGPRASRPLMLDGGDWTPDGRYDTGDANWLRKE